MVAACLAIGALLVVLCLQHLAHDRERQGWARERNLLISRIQTPHMAPSLAVSNPTEEPEFTGPLYAKFDNDDSFNEAQALT